MGAWVVWRRTVVFGVAMVNAPSWPAATSLEGTREEAVHAARHRAGRDVREGDTVVETEHGCVIAGHGGRSEFDHGHRIDVEVWPAGHQP